MLDCLRALYADLVGQGASAEVFVVDNASRDGSVAAVREAYPLVTVIANDANVGFGSANNQAMARATGEFLLLLNSDAFVTPGTVAALVASLRERPDCAVAGPRLLNGDGTLQPSCYRYPSPSRAWFENLWLSAALPRHPVVGDYRRWAHDAERDVDWVIGACFLVRRAAYEQVGGFDERFYMYQEETDWQRRMKDKGWKIHFTPSAQATHLGGASGASESARINRVFFESLDRYEHKHHGPLGLLSLRIAMVIGCFLRGVLWAALLLAVPKHRAVALGKVKLYSWLCRRQLTFWQLTPGTAGSR